MLRKSGFLVITLSITAIGSATAPAAASQVFGGGNSHIAAQLHPGPVSTSVTPSQQVSQPSSPHPPIQVATGSATTSLGAAKIPMYPAGTGTVLKPSQIPVLPKGLPGISTTVQNAKVNCKTDPKLCQNPPPECYPMPTCLNPPTRPTPPGPSGKGPGGGPVVILFPQVPVQVPVAVSVYDPARVATGTGYVAAAQARPSIASQCVAAGTIPALAAGIDELLPTAQLSEADMTKVTELRQVIQVLSGGGKVGSARDVEEITMGLLGYQKVWLKCGLGTFDWDLRVASTDAGQQK